MAEQSSALSAASVADVLAPPTSTSAFMESSVVDGPGVARGGVSVGRPGFGPDTHTYRVANNTDSRHRAPLTDKAAELNDANNKATVRGKGELTL